MKNNKNHLVVFILIFSISLMIQAANISYHKPDDNDNKNIVPSLSAHTYEWNRTWGGIYSEDGGGVAVDSSDNVYIGGTTNTPVGADMVLVKYDSSGMQQWNQTWNSTEFWNSPDASYGIGVDSLDNIYIIGATPGFWIGSDAILVKYDSSGVQQWNRTWGGDYDDYGMGIAVDSSNNVYIAGTTESFGAGLCDIFIMKYDSFGVQQWNRTWGGDDTDVGIGVAVDSSNNVYVVGETYSFGAGINDMVLVKYDSSGDKLWNYTWGGSYSDYGCGVTVDSSGYIYITGSTGNDLALVKYDSSGMQQWNRTWDGNHKRGMEIAVDSSNNIYIVGAVLDGGGYDAVLVKYDSSGVFQWYHIWGGSDWDYGHGIGVDSSNNVYIGGETWSFGAGSSDLFLVKYYYSETTEISSEPAIPGYNLFLLLGILSVTVIILSKELKKS